MGKNEHDWRTKSHVYVAEDTELRNPESYAWSDPSGDDQRIITRGIAREGSKMNDLTLKRKYRRSGMKR